MHRAHRVVHLLGVVAKDGHRPSYLTARFAEWFADLANRQSGQFVGRCRHRVGSVGQCLCPRGRGAAPPPGLGRASAGERLRHLVGTGHGRLGDEIFGCVR